LHRQVAELGIADQVRFLGVVQAMPQLYRACDVVCIPSVAEPFGRTAIEAFAVGTPVAASAVGGLRETIEHEETGLLVEYGDVAGLSRALWRLLDDASLRHRLAFAAAAVAASRYSAQRHQTALCSIVERVLARRCCN
jgi:glycosyltransferase involved in cell wall biosynthesis